ncbi:MAG: hypothetical protein WD073_10475 [Xanthobacteraceae bacterium]
MAIGKKATAIAITLVAGVWILPASAAQSDKNAKKYENCMETHKKMGDSQKVASDICRKIQAGINQSTVKPQTKK